MFAVLIALAVLGIALYYVVVFLEKIFAGWANVQLIDGCSIAGDRENWRAREDSNLDRLVRSQVLYPAELRARQGL